MEEATAIEEAATAGGEGTTVVRGEVIQAVVVIQVVVVNLVVDGKVIDTKRMVLVR